MLAAMGPHMQKYLWWKKYLTLLQMVQFIAVMIHAFQLLFHNPCNYPMAFVWLIGAHAIMFYFLFSNFYKQAYKKVRLLHHHRHLLLLFIVNLHSNLNFSRQQKKNEIAQANQKKSAINNNDSQLNYNSSINETSRLYYRPEEQLVEESYTTTRQRVFIGSKN
jgi:hypothetical protein